MNCCGVCFDGELMSNVKQNLRRIYLHLHFKRTVFMVEPNTDKI